MYAELKLKICKNCKREKDLSEFREFIKNKKMYSRPFCKECSKEQYFKDDLWKHYRLRLPDYRKMYEAQEGKCACCGTHESYFKRQLHVDHCHKTKKVRGLLCTQCNPGIGYFQDSIERLEMAISYLKKFKK